MRIKKRYITFIILQVFELLLIVSLFRGYSVLDKENRDLVAQQQFRLISDQRTDLVRAIVQNDQRSLNWWTNYLVHLNRIESDFKGGMCDLNSIYQMNQLRDNGARSNYFNDLLNALGIQKNSGLSKTEAIKYLGPPDKTVEETNGEEHLIYHYTNLIGQGVNGLLIVTNGGVRELWTDSTHY